MDIHLDNLNESSDSEDDFTDKKLGIDTWKQKKQDIKGLHSYVRSHKSFCPYTCDAYTRSYGVQQGSPVTFSPDGKSYAFISSSFSIYVKSLFQGGKDFVLNGHRAQVRALLFHPHRSILVSAGEEGIFVWDLANGGAIIQRLSTQQSRRMHDSAVDSICWGYNASVLFSGSNDSTIIIFHLTNRNTLQFVEQIAAHKAAVRALVYNQQTHRLGSSGRDSVIRIWDVSGLDVLLADNSPSDVLIQRAPSASSSPASTGDESNPDTNNDETASSGATSSSIYDVSPTSPEMLRQSTTSQQNTASSLKSTVNKFFLLWSMEGHRGDVLELDFIRNGRYVVSGARDNSMKIWDALTGHLVRDVSVTNGHTGDVEVLKTLDSENMVILTGSGDGSTKIWRLGNDLIYREQALADGSTLLGESSGTGHDGDNKRGGNTGLDDDDDDDDDDFNQLTGQTSKNTNAVDMEERGEAQRLQMEDPFYHDRVLYSHSLHGDSGIAGIFINPVYPVIVSSSLACEIRVWNTSDFSNFQLVNQFLGHRSGVADCVVFKSDFTKSNPNALSSLSIGADASLLLYDINNVLVEGHANLPFAPRQVLITSDGRFCFICGNGYDTLVYSLTYVQSSPIHLPPDQLNNTQKILQILASSVSTTRGPANGDDQDGGDLDGKGTARGIIPVVSPTTTLSPPTTTAATTTTTTATTTTTTSSNEKLPPLVTSSIGVRLSSRPIAKLVGHCGRIFSIAIDDDNTVLASGSQDYHINLYDLRMLYQLFPQHTTERSVNAPTAQQGSFDHHLPLMGGSGHAHTPPNATTAGQHNHHITGNTSGNSGGRMTGYPGSDSDQYTGFAIYDDPALIPIKPIARYQPATGHIHSLAISKSARSNVLSLAAGLSDRSIHVFDVTIQSKVVSPQSNYSPQSSISSGSWLSQHYTSTGHRGVVSTVVWSNPQHSTDQYLYSTGWDKTIIKWLFAPGSGLVKQKTAGSPTATDRAGSRSKSHSSKINDLCLSEDGQYVITASSDQSCILWDTQELNPIVSYATPTMDGGMNTVQSIRDIVIIGTEHGMLFEYPLFKSDQHSATSSTNPFKLNTSKK